MKLKFANREAVKGPSRSSSQNYVVLYAIGIRFILSKDNQH